MKVLVAHNRYRSAQPSGENAVVDADIAALREAGTEVLAVQPSSDDIAALTLPRRLGVATGPVLNPWGVRSVARAISTFGPDVLHLHNVVPQLSPWIVRTAAARGVPVVQTVHNFRHTCVSGMRFRDGGPCDDCVGRVLPIAAVRHACYRGSRAQTTAMVAGQVTHRRTWRLVDRFLAVTPFVAAQLGRLGVAPDRVVIRETAAPDPGPPTPPGRNVLFAGRLDEMKGAPLLLGAWSATTPPAGARLRIAGSGPLLGGLRAAAADRSDVDVLGPLDEAGVAREMRDAALVAIPSRWYEGQPRVLAEALAHGRPVLTTSVGGSAMTDPGVGWTVAPETEELRAALAVLRDTRALATVGRLARRRYEERHTPERALAGLLAVYRSLLERPS